jgi:hypothetical protein
VLYLDGGIKMTKKQIVLIMATTMTFLGLGGLALLLAAVFQIKGYTPSVYATLGVASIILVLIAGGTVSNKI